MPIIYESTVFSKLTKSFVSSVMNNKRKCFNDASKKISCILNVPDTSCIFDSIYGQDHAKHIVSCILSTNPSKVIIIIEGPHGLGKTTFAHAIAGCYNQKLQSVYTPDDIKSAYIKKHTIWHFNYILDDHVKYILDNRYSGIFITTCNDITKIASDKWASRIVDKAVVMRFNTYSTSDKFAICKNYLLTSNTTLSNFPEIISKICSKFSSISKINSMLMIMNAHLNFTGDHTYESLFKYLENITYTHNTYMDNML